MCHLSIAYYLRGEAILGDYDNDGDLDFLLTDNNYGIQKIYRNNYEMKAGLSLPNTRAGAPIINPVVMMEDGIRFSWNAPIEKDETFPNGLTYNLRYKNIESENWLGSAMSDDDGNRRVFSMGNMELNKSFTTRLLSGTYVWQVQAIDGGFLEVPGRGRYFHNQKDSIIFHRKYCVSWKTYTIYKPISRS